MSLLPGVSVVLSEYFPSCLRMSFFFVFHCYEVFPNVLSKHRQSVSWNYTCLLLVQVSPNVLSEYQQSAWGSYTCLLLVLDWAQLILHLSRWAAVAGLQVMLPSASNILSKYLRFVWGSHFLFSLPSVTIVLSSTFLWSHFSYCFQVSPGVCFLISFKELLLSVKPVSSSSYLPSHFNFIQDCISAEDL